MAPRLRQKEVMAATRRKVLPPPDDFDPRAWSPEQKARWLRKLFLHITEGGSLVSFTRRWPQGPGKYALYDWIEGDPIIAAAYTRARERSADTLAEQCVAIADEVEDAGQFDAARVNAARLRVDARKWVASKLKPKVYADRIETVQSGALTVQHTITDDERAKALALILGRQVAASAPSLTEAQRLIEAQAIDVTPKDKGSVD